MKVSVCIPTYKRPESLITVVTRFLDDVEKVEEILIGVTGDLEDSIGSVQDMLNQVIGAYAIYDVPVRVKAELSGLMEAKQWFKETAKSEVLLFVDDDAIVGEGYFDLVQHFKDKNVGAVSGTLQTPVNVGGYKDWSDTPIEIPEEEKFSNTLMYDKRRKTLHWFDKYQVYMVKGNRIFECEYLIGTALFIRKDLLEIDMEFQRGACAGEELDFTYRIYREGYKLIYDTSRIAWHLHVNKGGMREKDRSKDKENLSYFVKKWGLGEGIETGISIYKEVE